MAETNIALDPMPFTIRSSMGNGVGHSLQNCRRYRVIIKVYQSGDTTHQVKTPIKT
jgi:hypothetical protein